MVMNGSARPENLMCMGMEALKAAESLSCIYTYKWSAIKDVFKGVEVGD